MLVVQVDLTNSYAFACFPVHLPGGDSGGGRPTEGAEGAGGGDEGPGCPKPGVNLQIIGAIRFRGYMKIQPLIFAYNFLIWIVISNHTPI